MQVNTLLKLLISTKHQRQKTAKIKQEEATRWNRHEEGKINKHRDKSKLDSQNKELNTKIIPTTMRKK